MRLFNKKTNYWEELVEEEEELFPPKITYIAFVHFNAGKYQQYIKMSFGEDIDAALAWLERVIGDGTGFYFDGDDCNPHINRAQIVHTEIQKITRVSE